MKLKEILYPQQIDEGFVPIETLTMITALADESVDNISYRFTLAHVIDYLKDHKVTAERFRDIGEYQTSRECIDKIRTMSKADVSKLAKNVLKTIQAAMDNIDQDGYTNSQDELAAFLKKSSKSQD